MFKKLDKIDKMIKQWEDLPLADKQMYAMMVGASAGLILKGLMKMKHSKNQMEVINLVVPKDCELMIFVKGGK